MDPLYLDGTRIFVSEFWFKKIAKHAFSVFLARVQLEYLFDVFPPGIGLQVKIFIFKFCNFAFQGSSFLFQLGHL